MSWKVLTLIITSQDCIKTAIKRSLTTLLSITSNKKKEDEIFVHSCTVQHFTDQRFDSFVLRPLLPFPRTHSSCQHCNGNTTLLSLQLSTSQLVNCQLKTSASLLILHITHCTLSAWTLPSSQPAKREAGGKAQMSRAALLIGTPRTLTPPPLAHNYHASYPHKYPQIQTHILFLKSLALE